MKEIIINLRQINMSICHDQSWDSIEFAYFLLDD